MAVDLTIPAVLPRTQTVTAFLQVAGADDDANRLMLNTGSDRVAVRHNAAVGLRPVSGKRHTIALESGDGEVLCFWTPGVRVIPALSEPGWLGFMPSATTNRVHSNFFIAGEPVVLPIGRGLSDVSRFSIGGEEAPILARAPWLVILGDPQPRAGIRTVTGADYAERLAFLSLSWELLARGRDRGVLRRTVRGRDSIPLRTLPERRLFVANFSPEQLALQCGNKSTEDLEWAEVRRIAVQQGREGELIATCNVRIKAAGTPRLTFRYNEIEAFHPATLLPRRVPWPYLLHTGMSLTPSFVN